jgi:hypothetical protein
MIVVKAIFGLCFGFALVSFLQTVGIQALQESIKSSADAGLPVGNAPLITNLDAEAIKRGITATFGAIDTREGQHLAIESTARRVDIQNRSALSYIPLPKRFGR